MSARYHPVNNDVIDVDDESAELVEDESIIDEDVLRTTEDDDDDYGLKNTSRDEGEEDGEQQRSTTRDGDQDGGFETFEFARQGEEQDDAGVVDKEDLSKEAGKWMPSDMTITARVNTRRRFVCVDYPGIIKNKDRAIATLKGQEEIKKASRTDGRLELFFRPEDPFCKPALGHYRKTSNLLIKCCRRRVAGSTVSNSGDGFEYKVEVLGVIDGIISFNSPCDYQYLPLSKEPNGQFRDILSSIQIKFEDQREEYLSRDVPLFLPPIAFSRKEKPAKYHFQPDTPAEVDAGKDEEAIGTSRKSRVIGTQAVNYGDHNIPMEPLEKAVENFNRHCNQRMEDFLEKVKRLFEERPLWSRAALSAQFDLSCLPQMRLLLPMVSYYIVTGPWRQLWCKFGYNPHKDITAKVYQAIDFRIRTTMHKLKVQSKRGSDKIRIGHTYIAKAMTDATFKEEEQTDASAQGDTPAAKMAAQEVGRTQQDSVSMRTMPIIQGGVIPKLNLTYMFHPHKVPPYRQMRYQVCDIYVDRVQDLLHQNDGQETECTERDGWCISDFTDLCRDILAECTGSMMDG